jgi:hypothetical protein
MTLYATCIDADLFGKPPSPLSFEGDPVVYSRKKRVPAICIISQELLSSGKLRIGGNSIAGSNSFFQRCQYNEFAYGAADTDLIYSLSRFDTRKTVFAIMDGMNLVAERRTDLRSHTWKINVDKVKSDSQIFHTRDDLMV